MNYTMLEGAKLLSSQMKRFIEFDVLRGALLLMMSVDHSPSSLRRFTDQHWGSSPPLNASCSSPLFLPACSFANAPKSWGSPQLDRLRFDGPAASTGHILSLFASHLFSAASSYPSFLASEIC